jgi:DNA ligase (NAD+)
MNQKNFEKMSLDGLKDMLLKAADAYYNDEGGESLVMTDEEFDIGKEVWERRSGKRWQIGAAPRVSSRIGAIHGYKNFLGTLDKVNSIEELAEYLESIGVEDISETVAIFASLKYDGHSVGLEYEDNKLKQAVTRGKDGAGKDLTGYFKEAWGGRLKTLKFEVPGFGCPKDFAIAFEAAVKWKDLDAMNEEFGTTYKSPRSSVGGILKEDGIEMSKYLSLVPLKLRIKDTAVPRIVEVKALEVFKDAPFSPMDIAYLTEAEPLIELYDSLSADRSEVDFQIDGLVIEIADDEMREDLGYDSNVPKFARALKFPYTQKRTVLKDVEWYTEGNSGTYTPVAVFEPVIINGHTYERTSLANLERFLALDLHKGDHLLFDLRNEVLGWVDKIEHPDNGQGEKFEAPTHCSFCEHPLHQDTFLKCTNDFCDLNLIGNVQQFVDKMGIKGLQRQTLEKLFEADVVRRPEDLLRLAHLREKGGPVIGTKVMENICKEIDRRLFGDKPVYDYEILGSLNIDLISRDRAKIILQHRTLGELLEDPDMFDTFQNVAGIGEEIINSLFLGLQEEITTLDKLMTEINYVSIAEESRKAKQDAGRDENSKCYTVVVTGGLKYYGRDEFKHEIEKLGHKMVGKVTKKTDFLITNDTSSGTVKNKEAAALGVRIIDEQEAIKILGVQRRGPQAKTLEEEL